MLEEPFNNLSGREESAIKKMKKAYEDRYNKLAGGISSASTRARSEKLGRMSKIALEIHYACCTKEKGEWTTANCRY